METIRYTDIEMDYMRLPQVTPTDCARMARAFLQYVLGVYLFANGGLTMFLRWLALFSDFGRARDAN